jgi:hypothetical protein
MRRLIVLGAALLIVMAACGREGGAGAPSLSVTAKDYSFEAPETVAAGLVEFKMTNEGKEPHQVQLLKLRSGVDVSEVIAAAKAESGPGIQPLVRYAGGPNGVDTGEEQNAIVNLTPGNYALACLIPNAEGTEHLALGMAAPLEVTGDVVEDVALPETDYRATATESTSEQGTRFDFGLPESWSGSILFTNQGAQPHEFQVLGIREGVSEEDFVKSFQGPPTTGGGPPPYVADGGGAVIAAGGSEVFDLDVQPGTYFAMCFVGDPTTGAPHFALGMMKRFEVKE